MTKRGRSARNKGHSYERKIVKEFMKLGWKDCVTSRSESKRTDDAGVDLMYTEPYNVQCKAQEKMTENYFDLLDSMPDKGINVIFHKRNYKGEVAVLSKEDFYKLIKK
jgi:hypothetical protein